MEHHEIDKADFDMTANQLMVKYDVNRTTTAGHPYFTRAMSAAGVGPLPSGNQDNYWIWVRDCLQLIKPKATGPGLINGTRVDVADGKYSVIFNNEGGIQALRYGEPWEARDLTGDKFVHMLALELYEARMQLIAQDQQFEKSNKTIKELLEAVETLKAELPMPEALTEELRYVLGMPNFQCGPIAEVYRNAGYNIPPKAEAEQAFVIHRFARLAIKHKENWKAVAEQELQAFGAPTHNKVAVPDTKIVVPK